MNNLVLAGSLVVVLLYAMGSCNQGGEKNYGNGNLDNVVVGKEPPYSGGCEDALKKLLRDPDSLQKADYRVTEASPSRWVMDMSFRSKNGFGGYGQGTATCSFDGKTYLVEMD